MEIGARLGMVPSKDWVEDAGRMRGRIDECRLSNFGIVSSKVCVDNHEADFIGANKENGAKRVLRRIKTVRRKVSRFTEIGCTLGGDLTGTVCSTTETSEIVQQGTQKASAVSTVGRLKTSSVRSRSAKTNGSWVRKTLQI